MTLEGALVALLLQDAAVALLVGSRIDPMQSPQRKSPANASDDPGSFPRITYRRISTSDRVISQDGPGTLTRARIQFDVYALTATSAAAVLHAIVFASEDGQRLHGWKQTDMNGCYVQKVELESDTTGDSPPQEGGATGVFTASIDALCDYDEE